MLAPTVLIVIPTTIRWDNRILAQQTIVESFNQELAISFPNAVAKVSGGLVKPTAHIVTLGELDVDAIVAEHEIEPADFYREINGKITNLGPWFDPHFGKVALTEARLAPDAYDFVIVLTDREQFAPASGIFGITSGRWCHVFPYAGTAAAVAKSHIHPGFVEHEFVHELEAALREHGFTPPDYHGIVDEIPGHEVLDEIRVWFDRAKEMLPYIRTKRRARPPRGAIVAGPSVQSLEHFWSSWNAPSWNPPPPAPRERRRP